MPTKGEQFGIQVRAKGPGAHALHDRIHEVLAETFHRIFALCQQFDNAPSAHLLDLESVMERVELRARLQGLVMQFGEMLRFFDPLVPSCQTPVWGQNEGVHPLHDLINNWAVNLRPLPEEENTDETWELFFAAVAAAEQNNDDVHGRIAELKAQAPKSDKLCDWSWRVFYYTKDIAPEYRRWFTGIEGEVTLPRI